MNSSENAVKRESSPKVPMGLPETGENSVSPFDALGDKTDLAEKDKIIRP